MKFFLRIDGVLGRVYDAFGTLAGVTIGLFAVAIPIDLLMRLLGVGNLPGMQEVIEYALFVCVFLAAPWVLRLGGHIRIDVIVKALSAGAARRLERTIDLFGLGICLLIVYFGIANMIEAYEAGSAQRKTFVIYDWVLLLFLSSSFGLMAIEFMCRVVRAGAPPDARVNGADEAGF